MRGLGKVIQLSRRTTPEGSDPIKGLWLRRISVRYVDALDPLQAKRRARLGLIGKTASSCSLVNVVHPIQQHRWPGFMDS
ncbi:hypothetical protein AGR7A_pAt10099 [Agrobacterium deltaense NCPPB 1641]|uniref:Uncharacterized protein n=1 Tax=Agrobacterium deltaense NCPPB 1641 TaxID=1183425 RepID=A0A1S7U774_9HYPH|nr:hypothetical protein AGR7A_pAt10099 [Agrobacterium deltaense NCPPB 1641]